MIFDDQQRKLEVCYKNKICFFCLGELENGDEIYCKNCIEIRLRVIEAKRKYLEGITKPDWYRRFRDMFGRGDEE